MFLESRTSMDIEKLEQEERTNKDLSNRVKELTPVYTIATALLGLISIAISDRTPRAITKRVVLIGLPAAIGLGELVAAGEIFDRFADKAGMRSERLIDRLPNSHTFRRSRLTLVK